MHGINKAVILGNLTRDVVLRETLKGTKVCNLSVATNRVYTDNEGQKQDKVEYHEVICFSKTAEVCAKFLHKASRVYVEGEMRTNEWEKDGIKHRRTEIVASDVVFLDRKIDQENSDNSFSELDPLKVTF